MEARRSKKAKNSEGGADTCGSGAGGSAVSSHAEASELRGGAPLLQQQQQLLGKRRRTAAADAPSQTDSAGAEAGMLCEVRRSFKQRRVVDASPADTLHTGLAEVLLLPAAVGENDS